MPLVRGGHPLAPADLAVASVAIIDVAADPTAAIAFSAQLRKLRPTLPVVAFLCCPEPVRAWDLAGQVEVGVRHLVDSMSPAREFMEMLERAADGAEGVHLVLRGKHADYADTLFQRDGAAGLPSVADRELLALLAKGHSDRAVGSQLHVSLSVVRRRIEILRDRVGARNRVELAAWAGANGFYQPDQLN